MNRIEINIVTGKTRQIPATAYIVDGIWTLIDDGQPVPRGAVLASTMPMPEVVSEPPVIGQEQVNKLIEFLKENPDIVSAAKL